jgi:hypothetical protein
MADEREITTPVDLCDGRRLSPAARGWSRRPMVRANLCGAHGRKKRWDYWCVITPDVVASFTYADIDYAGLANCWVLDRHDRRETTAGVLRPFGRGFELPEQVCTGTAEIADRRLNLSIVEHIDATSIHAGAPSAHGRISIELDVAKPDGHESLNVVIPWSHRKFQFTSKQNTRPVTGTITVGDRTYDVGPVDGVECFAVQDLGRGIWPYANRWNWAAASGRSTTGRLVGLQFGGKWTVGTGFTENGLCIDGRLTKLHDELDWSYSWDDPMRPWRVTGDDVDVTLTPWFDRHDDTDLTVLKMEVHQCFGTWSGWVRDASGDVVELGGIDGFAEEARNRW